MNAYLGLTGSWELNESLRSESLWGGRISTRASGRLSFRRRRYGKLVADTLDKAKAAFEGDLGPRMMVCFRWKENPPISRVEPSVRK